MSLLDDAQALTILDLVDQSSKDFAFSNWETVLDNTRCFRVVGLAPLLQGHGIQHAHIFSTKEYITKALSRVPAAWLTQYPTSDKGWKDCKRDQFSNAFHTRPIRFDKACISILTACAALDENGKSSPTFFENVKILPQVYFVDGFTDRFYSDYVKRTPLEDEILMKTYLSQSQHLENIAKGHRVTKQTAKTLLDILKPTYGVIRNISRERKKPVILADEVINYIPAASVGSGGSVSVAAAAQASKQQ